MNLERYTTSVVPLEEVGKWLVPNSADDPEEPTTNRATEIAKQR